MVIHHIEVFGLIFLAFACSEYMRAKWKRRSGTREAIIFGAILFSLLLTALLYGLYLLTGRISLIVVVAIFLLLATLSQGYKKRK